MNKGLRVKGRRFLTGGFTLTELMVVVGIMTIMNLLILAKYPEFSQRMALKRTSEDVALIIRQAQTYSLGIKKPLDSEDEYSGFGVSFSKEASNNKTMTIFTKGEFKKDFQKYKINTGDIVSDLKVCNSSCSSKNITSLDIFYPRASSMAKITDNSNSTYSNAEITIKSPKGKTRIIKVWISGQVSIVDGPK